MNADVRAFAQGLYDNPPANLAEWLAHDPTRQELHFREFDLDDPADPRRVEDANTALPELIRLAGLGRTLTFGAFVKVIGRGNPRMVGGNFLNPISALCISQQLPPLWTLVVRADTGLPSGFWREHTDEEKIARQEECFAYYGARRADPLPQARTARRIPDVVVRETCPRCFTELTPSGSCMC